MIVGATMTTTTIGGNSIVTIGTTMATTMIMITTTTMITTTIMTTIMITTTITITITKLLIREGAGETGALYLSARTSPFACAIVTASSA